MTWWSMSTKGLPKLIIEFSNAKDRSRYKYQLYFYITMNVYIQNQKYNANDSQKNMKY